jgi:hypothetical protein
LCRGELRAQLGTGDTLALDDVSASLLDDLPLLLLEA